MSGSFEDDLRAERERRPADAGGAGVAGSLTARQAKDPTSTVEAGQLIASSFAENQRGELREADVAPSIGSGGGKPGQGYPAVRIGSGGGVERDPGVVSPLLGAAGASGGGRDKVPVIDDPTAIDTYNQNEVGGGVTNTLARSPTTALALPSDPETGRAYAEGAASSLDPPPDGRRYAACGDGVAAPCATWIGMRLARAMRDEPVED